MERERIRVPPRWLFVLLSVGGAWASGIYLGRLSVEGVSSGTLAPLLGFAALSLLMAWGAVGKRPSARGPREHVGM